LQAEVNTKYDALVHDIPIEPRIKKLPLSAQPETIEERKKQLEETRQLQLDRNVKTFSSRK
jgi:hypothetical protein